jgi:hypothetical protein
LPGAGGIETNSLGGEAKLFASELLFANEANALESHFQQPVTAAYQEILSALKRKNRDLAALSKRYQQIQARDYFQCELGAEVRAKLLAAQGGEIT